jgi:hypothetical protein
VRADEASRLKELEGENSRLKKLLAEAELDKAMLKELAEGKWWPRRLDGSRWRSSSIVFGVSERRAWRLVGQHRSSQWRPGRPRTEAEEKLRSRLRQIARSPPAGDGRPPMRWSGSMRLATVPERRGHDL